MIFIYFALGAIVVLGGLVAYVFMQGIAGMAAVMVLYDPSLATDPGYLFVTSIWVWMPLILIVAAGIYVYVNSQLEAEAYPYA